MSRPSRQYVTTEFLNRKTDTAQLRTEIHNIAIAIDGKIKEAHNAGLNTIAYELPENFSIKNIEREDAQLIIYTKLVSIYEEGGFEVKMKYTDKAVFMIFRWINRLSQNEREDLRKVLSERTIK